MKRYILPTLVALVTFIAAGATANAVEFGVGPGGVYVGPDRYRPHDYYDHDYGRGCRIVIMHRINRYGEDVEIRRRICD